MKYLNKGKLKTNANNCILLFENENPKNVGININWRKYTITGTVRPNNSPIKFESFFNRISLKI